MGRIMLIEKTIIHRITSRTTPRRGDKLPHAYTEDRVNERPTKGQENKSPSWIYALNERRKKKLGNTYWQRGRTRIVIGNLDGLEWNGLWESLAKHVQSVTKSIGSTLFSAKTVFCCLKVFNEATAVVVVLFSYEAYEATTRTWKLECIPFDFQRPA